MITLQIKQLMTIITIKYCNLSVISYFIKWSFVYCIECTFCKTHRSDEDPLNLVITSDKEVMFLSVSVGCFFC